MNMDYKVTILKNDLRVVTTCRPSGTTVIRIYVRAGSRYDDEHQGKAHFVEHMLFTGTANRSSRQIYSDIESIGGVIQANTAKEYATFSVAVMDRYLGRGLDVLADVITNPVFDRIAFLKEKLVIMEEIRQAQDSQSIIWDLFSETLWVENPIRWPVRGRMESLRDLEYEDMLDFYQERYTARNIVVSVCGDIDHERAVEQVSQQFSYLETGEELRPAPTIEPPSSRRTAHIEKDIHQTSLMMGVLAASMKDEDRYAVKLIDRILGSGGSSRLSQRLREEEKYVYSIHSLTYPYEDTGCFAVYTACSPENIQKVESLILEEWERLSSEPVSDEELEAARRSYEGTLTRECETNMYVAGFSGIEALLCEIEPFAESIEKINAVTKEDIMDAAKRYLSTSAYTMITVGRNWQE
ncbi:M16 family metallopeptidase [Candidatus Poribacteria bacterium]